ncbi:glycosyltransferase family 39 protein [Streptomyces sp. PSKA28]|uniref:Glycosyltransferase family 39 protein n=2 Tax=Streptomyces TaxID=1883 RepID=A0A7W0IBV8_9ACTN|nr:glycosyltransferase family 39 protein [Streptomyces himalayensis subsp. himalayensis]
MRRGQVVAVAVAVVICLAIRLFFLLTTHGRADVDIFHGFARAIEQFGPIRVYEQPLHGLPVYNHPPLAGWMLLGMSELERMGIPFLVLIRLPATLADAVSVVLVFEIVRQRARVHTAVVCAWTVALSPILVCVSGYHGNTDPVAVMFALAAAYLLADRKRPLAAGLVAALSVSVKFIPVVAIPVLLVVAARGGQRVLVRFSAGLAGLMTLVWGPVLLTVPGALKDNVLNYEGSRYRLWGLIRFADWLDVPEPAIAFAKGPGHLLFVLLCVAVGVWLAWLRPDGAPVVVGLTLALLLLLSTASGAHYLSWAVVGLCVSGMWAGLAYNAVVGVVAYLAYTGGSIVIWSRETLLLGAFGWAVLAAGIASGMYRLLIRPGATAGNHLQALTKIGAPRSERASELADHSAK